mgnify:FL=1
MKISRSLKLTFHVDNAAVFPTFPTEFVGAANPADFFLTFSTKKHHNPQTPRGFIHRKKGGYPQDKAGLSTVVRDCTHFYIPQASVLPGQ